MDIYLIFKAIILGIVEGLTEFLPVSSTGHLIIVGDVLKFVGERAKTFEIFIQLGSILGVVWHYRRKVSDLVVNATKPPERRFILNIFIAFLPAAIVGLLAHKYIKIYLFNPTTVAGALIIGGIVILLIERYHRPGHIQSVEAITPLGAFKVGCAQILALFPGVSRAGATIMGGLVTGFDRKVATEFSFFLAIPTMFAATLYDLYKNIALLKAHDVVLFAVGFVMAFLTALVVVKVFLAFVARYTFRVFAYYRIVFGLFVLVYFWKPVNITGVLQKIGF